LQTSGLQLAGAHCPFWQVSPAMQAPQSSLRPQPSPIEPQYFPEPVPHATCVHDGPPWHKWSVHCQPAGQSSSQLKVPPQPSPKTPPQYCPPDGLHVSGVQTPVGTHWWFWHVSPAMQVAQSRLPPQLSPMVPQYLPAPVPQVTATQLGPPLQTLAVQRSSPGQAPHSSRPPHPLPMLPQY
jgi:hypothetical protein